MYFRGIEVQPRLILWYKKHTALLFVAAAYCTLQ